MKETKGEKIDRLFAPSADYFQSEPPDEYTPLAEREEKKSERLKNMLEDVVNELDLSDQMIEKHGPIATPPAELVRLVLARKELEIKMLKAGFKHIDPNQPPQPVLSAGVWVKASVEMFKPKQYVILRGIDENGKAFQRGSWECRWHETRPIICFYDVDGKMEDFIPEENLSDYEILDDSTSVNWPSEEEIEKAINENCGKGEDAEIWAYYFRMGIEYIRSLTGNK